MAKKATKPPKTPKTPKTPETPNPPTKVIAVRVKLELARSVEMMAIARRESVNAYCVSLFTAAVTPPEAKSPAAEAISADSTENNQIPMPEVRRSGSIRQAVNTSLAAGSFGYTPPPSEPMASDSGAIASPAALYELRRIGNNLNQIARAANSGKPLEEAILFDVQCLLHLFEALADTAEYRRRIDHLKHIRLRHDSADSSPGSELSRGHALRSA